MRLALVEEMGREYEALIEGAFPPQTAMQADGGTGACSALKGRAFMRCK